MENKRVPSLYMMTVMRRTIMGALLLGVGLTYFLIGRSPGWQPFILVSALGAFSLIYTALSLKGNGWIILFTFMVLLLAIFWKPGEPWSALLGAMLVLFNAFKLARQDDRGTEESTSDSAAPEAEQTDEPSGYVGL
jgi:hypothetical protein